MNGRCNNIKDCWLPWSCFSYLPIFSTSWYVTTIWVHVGRYHEWSQEAPSSVQYPMIVIKTGWVDGMGSSIWRSGKGWPSGSSPRCNLGSLIWGGQPDSRLLNGHWGDNSGGIQEHDTFSLSFGEGGLAGPYGSEAAWGPSIFREVLWLHHCALFYVPGWLEAHTIILLKKKTY